MCCFRVFVGLVSRFLFEVDFSVVVGFVCGVGCFFLCCLGVFVGFYDFCLFAFYCGVLYILVCLVFWFCLLLGFWGGVFFYFFLC